MNIAKFLRTSILKNNCERLLLYINSARSMHMVNVTLYRNQPIDLQCKSIDKFLFDCNIGLIWIKALQMFTASNTFFWTHIHKRLNKRLIVILSKRIRSLYVKNVLVLTFAILQNLNMLFAPHLFDAPKSVPFLGPDSLEVYSEPS